MNRLLVGAPALLALVTCASAPRTPAAPVASAPAVTAPAVAPEATRSSRKSMVKRIVPHNVRLVTTEGGKVRRTASGVVIGTERTAEGASHTYVLTNAHAVDPEGYEKAQLSITLEKRGDVTEYPAMVVARGSVPDLDLALLRVAGVALEPAELASDDELEVGEDVVVAASPFGRSLSLSGGMLSQVEWDRETQSPRMLKTDAAIGYGASGGGVFSLETGRLLAIVEGYRTAKVAFSVDEKDFSFDVPMPGETFAAPSAKVRRFLAEHGFGRLTQRGPAIAPASQKARR
ncbi:serine protease [Myxococcaceae bacterium GXIMD 01537]